MLIWFDKLTMSGGVGDSWCLATIDWYNHPMLEWLAQTIAKHTLGYALRWHRSRLKVSLATHIEQSWSDRRIHMSITNHGNTPIIVDSWQSTRHWRSCYRE